MATEQTPMLELSRTQIGEVAVNAIQVGEKDFAGGLFERASRSFETAAQCCRALQLADDNSAEEQDR